LKRPSSPHPNRFVDRGAFYADNSAARWHQRRRRKTRKNAAAAANPASKRADVRPRTVKRGTNRHDATTPEEQLF